MPLRKPTETGLEDCPLAATQWSDRGPRVLLLHAIGFDRHTWMPVLPSLEGYSVVGVDLPGHGESGKPPDADYGLISLGSRIVRFLDELEWEDAVLVGNSLGGGTALAAALLAPHRVRGLALLGSVGMRGGLPAVGRLAMLPLVSQLGGLAPLLAIRLGLQYARARRSSLTAERCISCQGYLGSVDGRIAFFRTLRQLYGHDMERMMRHYHEIRCPTAVLQGDRDPLIRPTHAQRLVQAIPGAELIHLHHCGHFPQEECPEETGNALRGFLNRIHAAAPAGGVRKEMRG
ncbi:MAG: alpha/beta fold hydrolase [Armatimonadota bacterium]